ncbi:polymer-forming cytoskeletal protein [Amylibacter sp. SFDW26]|uniref:bactofilin family protein n=1 Tax=Amylibacter sp. SFDW26 TaxID=2652722 RepID=UPI001261ECE6|nr:polymer-forming cytoskeletal protein [Amylibacter sp. SFDW26]KAB7615726.1 polymer-forming cytoskeletal protein [Amylibacter sp. SFDW26]
MFSKSKINEPEKKPEAPKAAEKKTDTPKPSSTAAAPSPVAPKAKPPASVLSTDLHIKGNIKTSGDIQIEGEIVGDVRAHLLTVGQTAKIKGEVIADDVVVNGHVAGTVRGLKVRLTATARVEGDIIHKTIAIESGAHFEGSVRREEDPLTSSKSKTASAS